MTVERHDERNIIDVADSLSEMNVDDDSFHDPDIVEISDVSVQSEFPDTEEPSDIFDDMDDHPPPPPAQGGAAVAESPQRSRSREPRLRHEERPNV